MSYIDFTQPPGEEGGVFIDKREVIVLIVPGQLNYNIPFAPPLDFIPEGMWAVPSIEALPGNGFYIVSFSASHAQIFFKNSVGVTGSFTMTFYYYHHL
jgi:hypothetical protein